ncbi:LysM peptidoglycan-binding domain-containing protein, partial [Streptomyces sp. NPDC002589]|uniref:LysM peptidoglycan-binding domain-containing protein n=1 Tax=Streptomyces sp. NPDC002589 TaxID=3154420 RepID=UPI003320020F
MRNRSTAATIARALFAFLALVAIIVGVPLVLLAIGVLPDHVPGAEEISSALTSPDSGELFLGAVSLIGWYGWFSFVVSVVLETAAALHHRSAPKIRMLGGSQQLAGALVGGILILLPAGTAMASPATAAPIKPATVATASVTAGAHTATKAAAPAAASFNGPVHHVKDGDTLWDIAEQRLGGGIHWHRIVDANEGVRQADGSVITADTTVLQPNWTLRLPADATPVSSPDDGGQRAQTAGSTAVQDATHTVRPGETLSGIAEDELGNAQDYPQIADANKDVRQPDGRTLTDPDEIYPGWQLKIPAASSRDDSGPHSDTAAPPREHKPAPRQDHAAEQPGSGHDQTKPPSQSQDKDGHHQGAGQHGDGSGKQDSGQATASPHTPAEQSPAPDQPAERPSHDTPTEQAPQPHDTAHGADSEDQSVQTIAATGSILAAAVLAVIAARRARQQRRRRPKRRIPMPSGATADFEKQLRVASDITGTALADRALRTLAANCRQAGRPLPDVEAMRIASRGIELHMAAATPPVEPFTEHEDNPMVWGCPARGAALLDEDEAADITPPYPALVSLGETEDGDAVLVNLESIGLLRLAGSPADVRAVMLALAVELASSKLAPDTQIVLAGSGSDLHHLYPDQIEHHTDLVGAVPELQAHDAFQRQALADGGHDDLRAARLGEDGGDTWIPRILIATAPPTGPAAAELEDLLASRPRTSVAVVTAAGGELDLPGAWTLPAQPGTTVELPELDLAVKLQHLDDASYDRLVQLLATSSRTDDVPPPPWTGHTGPDTNGPRHTVPAGSDSALAPETTAAPQAPVTISVQGSDLATALPSFTALRPASGHDDPADDSSALYGEEEEGSALSATVAGSPAAGAAYDEQTDSNSAVESAGWDEPEPARDDPEQASALGADVWDTAEPEKDFDSVLDEVLGEREADSLHQPDGEEAGSGLSAAALGDGPDEEETPQADSAPSGDEEDAEYAESGLSAAALGESAAATTVSEARIIPRPSAATSTVQAALTTPPAEPAGPQVQVLGSVTLTGAQGRVGSNRI